MVILRIKITLMVAKVVWALASFFLHRWPWLVLVGTLSGCLGGLPLAQRRDAAYLMSEQGRFQKRWQLIETYDPYQDGILLRPESARYLTFYQDGEFLEHDPANYSTGQWQLSEDRDRLALTYAMQNNRRIPTAQRDTLFRYRIQYRSSDSLVLGVQGRHGIVQLRYRAAGDPE